MIQQQRFSALDLVFILRQCNSSNYDALPTRDLCARLPTTHAAATISAVSDKPLNKPTLCDVSGSEAPPATGCFSASVSDSSWSLAAWVAPKRSLVGSPVRASNTSQPAAEPVGACH